MQQKAEEEKERRAHEERERKRQKRGVSPSVYSHETRTTYGSPYSRHGQSTNRSVYNSSSEKAKPMNHNVHYGDSDSSDSEIERDDGQADSSTISDYNSLISSTFDKKWQKNHEFVFVTNVCKETKKEERVLRWRRYDHYKRKNRTTDFPLDEFGQLTEDQYRRIKRDKDWLNLMNEVQDDFERQKKLVQTHLTVLRQKKERFIEVQKQDMQKNNAIISAIKNAISPSMLANTTSSSMLAKTTSSSRSNVLDITRDNYELVWNNVKKDLQNVPTKNKFAVVREYIYFKQYIIETKSRSNKRNYLSGFKEIWRTHDCETVSDFRFIVREIPKQNNNLSKAAGTYRIFLKQRKEYVTKCDAMDVDNFYE